MTWDDEVVPAEYVRTNAGLRLCVVIGAGSGDGHVLTVCPTGFLLKRATLTVSYSPLSILRVVLLATVAAAAAAASGLSNEYGETGTSGAPAPAPAPAPALILRRRKKRGVEIRPRGGRFDGGGRECP